MVTAYAFIFLFMVSFGLFTALFVLLSEDRVERRRERLAMKQAEEAERLRKLYKPLVEEDKKWLDYHLDLAGVEVPRGDIKSILKEVE